MSRRPTLEICPECGKPVFPGEEKDHCSCRLGTTNELKAPPRRMRQQSPNAPPDMTRVVRVPAKVVEARNSIKENPEGDLEEDAPGPEDELNDGADAVDALLQQIFDQTDDPSPRKESVEELPTKEVPMATATSRTSNFLRTLAQTAKAQRAAYLDRLIDIPTSVIVLAEEVLPELVTAREEGDQERIKTIIEGLQQAKSEHKELVSFIDLHNKMQATKDPGLKEDFDRIVATARAMQMTNEARNAGTELDETQRDILKSSLDTMSKKAVTDFNARQTEAEKLRKRTASQAYTAIEAMATTTSILEALEAVQRGEKPVVVRYIGPKMPVSGPPDLDEDGKFDLRTLGYRAPMAWELVKVDEEHYRAYLKGEWGDLCFGKHTDPAVGELGSFDFDLEFSLKPKEEQRSDPFHAVRVVLGIELRAEKTVREKEAEMAEKERALQQAFQPYRDGTAPVLSASGFLQEQMPGTFYLNVNFTMRSDQLNLHLEAVLNRQEKDGEASLVLYATETPPQDRVFLEEGLQSLGDKAFATRVIVTPMTRREGEVMVPVLNPDCSPRMFVRVSCEPLGLRKALLDIPNNPNNNQKARLAALMGSQLRKQAQQENLRTVVDGLDYEFLRKVAEVALKFNVVQEQKARDKIQAMISLPVQPCTILQRALGRALQNELAAARQQQPAQSVETAEPHTADVAQVEEKRTEELEREPEPEPVAADPS